MQTSSFKSAYITKLKPNFQLKNKSSRLKNGASVPCMHFPKLLKKNGFLNTSTMNVALK